MAAIRAAADFTNFSQDLGGAASDLFQSVGDFQAVGSYNTAAQYAGTNADLEKESLAIKTAQINREIYQSIGGQKADVAAAGFSASGSALDLLRDSTAQGALVQGQNQVQGNIQIQSALAQQKAEQEQASAAETAGIGGLVSGGIKLASTLAPLLGLL